MRIKKNKPPRIFYVGKNNDEKIQDCGSIYLQNNEQITLLTNSQKEYDIVKKEWGFYATPSINNRLSKQGFKCALVKNKEGSFYVMLVSKYKIKKFESYLRKEKNRIVKWLDEL